MTITSWLVWSSMISVTQAAPIAAPTEPQSVQDPDAVRIEDVVVLGRRGSTSLIPEAELDKAGIDVLGAYDVGEVIRRLARDLGFEAPIIIVNGRRALNPADFIGFPPDALVRVEALPPQAGALYGTDPSRRVVNIVLQRAFRSRDALLKGARPTVGGRSSTTADLRQSEIADASTHQFGLQISRDTRLSAEEREDYVREHPGSEGLTLRPAAEGFTANASSTGVIGDWSRSVNATAGTRSSDFAFMAGGQTVETRQETQSLTLNGAVGGQVLGWSTQIGLDGSLMDTRQSGVADFRSRNLSAAVTAGVDRTVAELPAGSVRTNLVARLSYAEAVADVDIGRTRLSARTVDLDGTLVIPLSQNRPGSESGAGPDWGDLSLTVGGAVKGVAGTSARGDEASVGLNWSPVQKLRLSAQWSRSTEAPADQLRLGPVSYGPAVLVFDFLTGRGVDIQPLVGGNPDLAPQTVSSVALTASAGPYTPWRIFGALNARSAASTNGIGALPALTPEIEAAFPDRFTRDGDGRLTRIDQRPVNLGSTRADSLSANLTFALPLSRTPSPEAGALQFAINHTWQLRNRVALLPGFPLLDRLEGDGGGLSRHQTSIQADGRYRSWGLNAGLSWRGASRIRRHSGRDGLDDLKLAPLLTIDLRLSHAFGPNTSADSGAPRSRRYAGLRLELAAENLLDARPDATLGDDRPAPGYARNDQDPLGRTIRISLSKRF